MAKFQWADKNKSTFLVYRDGDYLGCDDNLADAQKRAQNFDMDPQRLTHMLAFEYPAFIALSASERKAAWRKYSNKTVREVIMSKYDKMGQTQLTEAYNKIVDECKRRQMGDLAEPVARFPDEETARTAVIDLETKVRAHIDADLAKKRATGTRTGTEAAEAKAKAPVNDPATLKPDSKLGKGKGKAGAKAQAEPAAKPAPKGGTKAGAAAESVLSTSPAVKKAPTALEGFLGQIEAREGTNKEKLATCLFKNFGKDVKTSEVCKHVYGNAKVVPAINAVIAGLSSTIKKKKLAYEIKRKEDSVGLYAASKAG
jgi:hypothetical protein